MRKILIVDDELNVRDSLWGGEKKPPVLIDFQFGS
jgi:hypothetical protein